MLRPDKLAGSQLEVANMNESKTFPAGKFTDDQAAAYKVLALTQHEVSRIAMPNFTDFIDELKAAGVVIEGESALVDKVGNVENWTEEVARLAASGRKHGIRFIHQNATREKLASIVRGYPFSAADGKCVMDNIMRDTD
ncbi:hypothetical protein WT71_10770 [Burkholderia stagnalis]|nr:hypothetical protein WT71_10770 [Burkholderia stagnalis]KWI72798.1 hypothetical protein WT73_11190 [Burkholderia stagnalis]